MYWETRNKQGILELNYPWPFLYLYSWDGVLHAWDKEGIDMNKQAILGLYDTLMVHLKWINAWVEVMDLSGIQNILPFLSILVVVLSVLIWFQSWRSQISDMRKIPGNLGWPVIGETISFVSDFSNPSGIYSFIKKRQHRFVQSPT